MISPRRDGKVNELKVFLQVLNTISNLSSNEIIWRVRFILENLTKNLRRTSRRNRKLNKSKVFEVSFFSSEETSEEEREETKSLSTTCNF